MLLGSLAAALIGRRPAAERAPDVGARRGGVAVEPIVSAGHVRCQAPDMAQVDVLSARAILRGRGRASKSRRMPRPPRDLAPGIQHIGVGAAGPANYFRDDVDHLTWTRLFVRTLARHGWTCIAMCQLSTHWHALVDVPDDSLARGMHELNSEYTKDFNARHGRVGYLVRDRYWSRRKTTAEEILTAFRYDADNPVKAGIVKRPEEWHWSSYATPSAWPRRSRSSTPRS